MNLPTPSPKQAVALLVAAIGIGCGEPIIAPPSTPQQPAPEPGGPDAPTLPATCVPAPASTGVLNPNCVYIMGTLTPGTVERDVLFHPEFPDPASYRLGFASKAYSSHLRSDGQLQFIDTRPGANDYRAYLHVVDEAPPNNAYPLNPGDNDVLLPTPVCAAEGRTVHAVMPIPDSTDYYYQCSHVYGRLHHSSQDGVLDIGESWPLATSPSGLVLARPYGLKEATLNRFYSTLKVVGLDGFGLYAARWDGDSFMAASWDTNGDGDITAMQFRVTTTGVATPVAPYIIGDLSSIGFPAGCALEQGGDLICAIDQFDSWDDLIVRLSTSAPPVVVFNESEHAVKLHGPQLITGP